MLQSIYKFLFNLCSSPQLPKNKDVDGILSHEEITAGLWGPLPSIHVVLFLDFVTNGAIVIHTQRLKSDPGGNLLS